MKRKPITMFDLDGRTTIYDIGFFFPN